MEVKVDAPVPEMQHAEKKKLGTIDLRWKDLCYSIAQGKTDRRTVLHAQDGCCKGGELMAFMGPSGSGKTSLLNSLAGRLPQQKGAIFSGELYVNEIPMQDLPCPFADISAYVEQEDVLYALSTVTETLRFQAKLRLPKSSVQEEVNKRIETILRQVGLHHVRNTNVGGSSFNGAIRGLSGGERKRLSIALELLHDPQVLFLDEPTTGLDSYQALNVMEKLRDLANANHTVVVSIHQPRSSIFAMLDSVIILAAGRPAFSGPMQDATKHFEDQGYVLPPKFNPADFFIDLVSVDQRDVDAEKKTSERLNKLCDVWQEMQLQLRHGVGDKSRKSVEELNQEILARKPEQPAGQTALVGPLVQLLIRGWREQTRDKVAMTIKNIFVFHHGFWARVLSPWLLATKCAGSKWHSLFSNNEPSFWCRHWLCTGHSQAASGCHKRARQPTLFSPAILPQHPLLPHSIGDYPANAHQFADLLHDKPGRFFLDLFYGAGIGEFCGSLFGYHALGMLLQCHHGRSGGPGSRDSLSDVLWFSHQ
jgi:ABC-type multidrug transport system ATPase subunit